DAQRNLSRRNPPRRIEPLIMPIPGPLNSILDVAGLSVGHASDAQLKSGVSVVIADEPAVASVHVMGGAPGTRDTDLLSPDETVDRIDAIT
ncbi:P1 family peptidase, partial [Acinetobacter baumannii]